MKRRNFVGSCLVTPFLFNGINLDKSIIMIWLGGGPPTIDMWDLKPNTKEGGPFSPIATKGDFEICEHLPLLANLGDSFSLIRTMSTREADHERGSYYVHTGFKPSPTIEHPSLGSIIAHELGGKRNLDIPSFFSISTNSFGGGYLGSGVNPLVVSSDGKITNMGGLVSNKRVEMLSMIESRFISTNRGELPTDHSKLYDKALRLNTSPKMAALDTSLEPKQVSSAYGPSAFGRSVLMARRLLQQGVPFVEVGFGGWDLHQSTHETLSNKLPELDKVISTLILDLKRLDLWNNTGIIMMGEFGRTPKINSDLGRDHWAGNWTSFVSGGLFKGGIAIGKTSANGMEIEEGNKYSSEDLIATTCQALGIDTKTNYTSKRGRPMNIVNGGKIINEILG